MISNRIIWIDFVKAIAIVLVVLGHSIQYSDVNFDENHLFRFIYSFHMPLFMFLSGYLAGMPNNIQFNFVLKRFRGLVIPFFMWLIVFYVFFKCSDGLCEIGPVDFLYGIMKRPDDGGLWFLWVLFLIQCIHFASLKIFNDSRGYYFSLLLVMLVLYFFVFCGFDLWFGLGLVKWHIFFFVMGCFFREKNILTMFGWRTSIALVPLVLFLELFWFRNGFYSFGYPLSGVTLRLYNLFFDYLVATIVIVFILVLARNYTRDGACVQWLSRNTLAIYAVHFIILNFALDVAKWNFGDLNMPLKVCFVFFVTILCSVVCVLTMRRFSLLEQLFLGRAR